MLADATSRWGEYTFPPDPVDVLASRRESPPGLTLSPWSLSSSYSAVSSASVVASSLLSSVTYPSTHGCKGSKMHLECGWSVASR
jgi:hypothetical protein